MINRSRILDAENKYLDSRKKKYTIFPIYEAYLTDGGGMGYYTEHKGFFSTYNEAEKLRKKDPFIAIYALGAIKVGNEIFVLNERHHGSIIFFNDKESFVPNTNPVQLDINTVSQKELDDKRKKELLSQMTEDDKRILGIK